MHQNNPSGTHLFVKSIPSCFGIRKECLNSIPYSTFIYPNCLDWTSETRSLPLISNCYRIFLFILLLCWLLGTETTLLCKFLCEAINLVIQVTEHVSSILKEYSNVLTTMPLKLQPATFYRLHLPTYTQ